jgi:thymidylate synthase ThyX
MTYINLAKFLQLRMHPSAQKEIRLVANEVAEKIIKEDETHTQEERRDIFINYAITPKRSLLGNKENTEDPLMNEVEVDKVEDEVTTNPEPININTLEEAGNLIKQNEELK